MILENYYIFGMMTHFVFLIILVLGKEVGDFTDTSPNSFEQCKISIFIALRSFSSYPKLDHLSIFLFTVFSFLLDPGLEQSTFKLFFN